MSNAVEIANVQSKLITVKNMTGRVSIHHAEGKLAINTFSRAVNVNEVKGSADIVSTTGGIAVNFEAVTDNIFLKSTSGKVKLSIPGSVPFNLTAASAAGSIHTHFDNEKSTTKKLFNLQKGNDPRFSININTTAGGIEVEFVLNYPIKF